VTCYVIDADTSYNMLLGRPWIHDNWIIPSTLHQCFKYVDDNSEVKTVFASLQPFKGVENYFTDSIFYSDDEENDEEPIFHVDDGNEADSECEPVMATDNPLVIYLDDIPCNSDTVDDDDEWVINENASFEYPVCVENTNDLFNTGTFHLPILTSMETCLSIEDERKAIYIIPSRGKDQSPIIFGKARQKYPTVLESDKDSDAPQFHHYNPNGVHIMKKMGYDVQKGQGLNFDKGM